MSSANTIEASSPNKHGTASIDHQVPQDNMKVEHVNKKPIKRVVPEKIAEVGQWKVAKMEDKAVVGEEDKAAHKDEKAVDQDDKAVGELHKTETLVEGTKTT